MWEKIEKNGVSYYTLSSWRNLGAELFVSTRKGGVSEKGYSSLNLARHVGDFAAAVTENRRRFLTAIEADAEDFITAQQTHGTNIRLVTAEDRGRGFDSNEDAFPDTDGLYTSEKGLLLATFYADCLPLALFDPIHKVLGMAHAGWRGTYENIGKKLLDEMKMTFGSDPKEVRFATGAGIGFCCYEVDKDFCQRFLARYPEAKHWMSEGQKGKYFFNNSKANADLMMAEGILRENIEGLSSCTCCNQRVFYSYRGSGGNCGRHGLFGRLI